MYTALGKKESGAFALDVAKKALEYHADWFGVPYPLPKCDLIAIPDFASGAMENWGLVTYRGVSNYVFNLVRLTHSNLPPLETNLRKNVACDI